MQPKALRNQAMVRGSDGLLRLEMVDAGRECVIDPLAELIWDLCDGSRNVEALAQAAGRAFDRAVPREEVFDALDFLADAGLIEERVAPPAAEANVSRRSLLVRIGPVVGAAAWMMSGVSARAGGLIQYNESASKESDRKAADRENNNKESGNKAAKSESDNKERGNKNHDKEFDDKQDWNRQQDAEKRRKADSKKTTDEINESESKREYFERKIKASWPKVYDIVGHKLSEFPELRQCWEERRAGLTTWGHTLTSNNYDKEFEITQSVFEFGIKHSAAARARFASAGFDLPAASSEAQDSMPFLAGDSQKKTRLVLEHVRAPAIYDNWRYALDTDNLLFEFNDPEAAYQFLSNRRATGTQTKK